MKKSDLYEDELAALMKALKDGKSVLTVKGVDNIENVRRRMIDRVGKDGGWRFYARKTEKMDESRIYIFSPACDDPEPARNWNGPHKLSSKESRKIQEAEQIRQASRNKNEVSRWILRNLVDPAMLHITVVPYDDIRKLGSVGKFETYMTAEVRRIMGRDDVRVMVLEAEKDHCSKIPAYNARLVFLEDK